MQQTIDACAGISGDEHRVGVRIGLMDCERRDIGGFDDGAASVLGGVAVTASESASD